MKKTNSNRLRRREPYHYDATGAQYIACIETALQHGQSIPLHVLLQWDDEWNDRQAALDLFDALGSAEKSLHANMGGHTGVPAYAGEDAAGFFARHLR